MIEAEKSGGPNQFSDLVKWLSIISEIEDVINVIQFKLFYTRYKVENVILVFGVLAEESLYSQLLR